MDVGRRGRLYALHLELVAHLRFVHLDICLTPAVLVTRARHRRPPRGRPRSARPLGRALPAGSVSSSNSLPPLVGDPPHTTHTPICTQRSITWFNLPCELRRIHLPRTPVNRTKEGQASQLRSASTLPRVQ